MAKLIDSLQQEFATTTHIDGKWYVAKSIRFFSFWSIGPRIKDAWFVLIGKCDAHYYYKQ